MPYGDLIAAQRAAEAHAAIDKVRALMPDMPETPARLVRQHRRERRDQAVADALTAFSSLAPTQMLTEAEDARKRDAWSTRLNITAVVLTGISTVAAVIALVH